MVVIHIKSTADKDEWLYQTECSKDTTELIEELAGIYNGRVRLKSQVMALWNLVNEDGGSHLEGREEGVAGVLEGLYEKGRVVLDVAGVQEKRFFGKKVVEGMVAEIENAARESFEECKGDTAIDELYKARDDPDLAETKRLQYWYFLELIDPQFKARDFLNPTTTKLWWAGKEIKRAEPLSVFIGKNEKTKFVGKLTSEAKGCPAREPKLGYAQQRELRQHFEEKRSAFQNLEPSELQDHRNVSRKPSDFVQFRAPTSQGTNFFGDGARSAVDSNAKAGGEGIIQLNTNVKPIHNKGRSEVEHSIP
eukprot:TRINITY_DN38176_c0_g1_i1.p1 TRINITY_DN38176_c0_g1~~TRINITY_DN38176_c0_g1_i1.p1  ORF type:complete len:307 (+),score=66.15 TRINITY_DN38176_c0_g1_i1:53-973(+)